MAAPKKQTVEYFPHYTQNGKTIFILEQTYGNDGYAFFFKLLELLGNSEGHYYDCNNPSDWVYLLAKTKVSEDTANSILDTLCQLGKIDKELWENRVIWYQNFVDGVGGVYDRRKCTMPTKEGLLAILRGKCVHEPGTNGINDDINSQSKVKESKVKESKEEKKESGENRKSEISEDENSISQKEKTPKPNILKPNPQKKKPTAEGRGFAKEFAKLLPNDRKVTAADLRGWAITYDELVRIDGRDKVQIWRVVKWARGDPFWKDNFLSAKKLRQKDKAGTMYYDVFLAKMRSQNGSSDAKGKETAEPEDGFVPNTLNKESEEILDKYYADKKRKIENRL